MGTYSLANQHVVIVGGSSGIGLATGILTQKSGANVTLIGRNQEKLEEALKQIEGARIAIADFTDENSINAALADLPTIHHVYVAAGSFVGGNILSGSMADFRQVIDTRVWGSVHVVRAAVPKMNGTGSITFTGGVSTDRPVAGAWPTAVATAAAEQLARALALELAPVRVNAVAPGWTDTPMWDALLGSSKENAFADVADKLPVAHIAQPADVANAVLFLMSNASTTGEVLHIDGGNRLV
jgi:NAD(P)-dependent dehydrogenase (short-subunit alcohol dehydrogenase family)